MVTLIVLICIGIIFWKVLDYYNIHKDGGKPLLKNFPFKHKGITYWYSRSCAVALFLYCKDKEDNWYVLANKRGEGCPDFKGYWNCPCGYLDFNEDSIYACARECFEETGLVIPQEKIKVSGVDTNPTSNHQNVTIRHRAVLDGTIDEWSSFSTKNSEEDEVDFIKWIPLSEIDKYKWAFSHNDLILKNRPQ